MHTECAPDRIPDTCCKEFRDPDFFSCLGPEGQKAFDALKEPRSYRTGQILYAQGEPAQGMFLLLSGELSVQRKCGQGRYHILQVLLPGDSVGVIPVFDGGPTSCTVMANSDATCWFIPAKPLRRLALEHPDLGEAVWRHVCAKFRNLVSMLEGMTLHSVPERVARLLLDQHRRNPERSLLEFPEGEEDLAHYIGCSRSTFSRALRQLNDDGMIRNTFPVIRLVDIPRLEEFASCSSKLPERHRLMLAGNLH